MRSRTPLPQRQQAHWGAFLEAAALFLALCVLGRSAALTLAAVVAAPFPAVQTALWWGQRNLQSETSDPEPEPAAEEQAPPASSAVPEAVQALTGGIEDYLVALQPEDAARRMRERSSKSSTRRAAAKSTLPAGRAASRTTPGRRRRTLPPRSKTRCPLPLKRTAPTRRCW